MGMSAGQARLLSITARMTDNELRSQMITNSKLRLADKSSEASAKYMDALNSQQLMYASYNDNGEKTLTALTPNVLTSYSDMKNQYAMVNSSGQILVSGTDAKNFENCSTLNEFLAVNGVEQKSEIEIPDNLLDSAYNLLKSQFPCWGSTGIQGFTGNDTSFNPYYAAHIEHVLASMLWEDTNDEQTITITNSDNGKTETITNSANSLVVGSLKELLQNISGVVGEGLFENEAQFNSVYTAATDEYGNQITRQFEVQEGTYVTARAWKLADGSSDEIYWTTFDFNHWDSTGIDSTAAASDNGWYKDYQLTGKQYVAVYQTLNTSYGLSLGSNDVTDTYGVKEVLNNNEELKEKIEVLYYQILNYLNTESGTNPANHGGADGSGMKGFRGLTGGTITTNGAFDTLSVEQLINEFTSVMSELTVDLIYNIYTSNDERMDLFEQIDGFEEINKLMNECLYDTTDPKYQWYTNLWYRMGGTDGVKTSNDTGKYKEIDPNFLNSAEWLQFALENGVITLEQVQFAEDGSQEYPNMGTYDWVSISYNNASDITSQDNEIAIAKAEVKYKNEMQEIENQDKKYDQDLKKLDTEHSALQTEYESVKSVIDKNVERSFKAFS